MDHEQTPLPGVNVEARQIIDQSHEAERLLFEEMLGDVPFAELFQQLVQDEGWYWRDAAYIAWRSIPRKLREPKTVEEFASLLGISRRSLYQRVHKNPAIDKRIAKGVVGNMLFEPMEEVLEALIESASQSNYKNHPDRKLYLEMTKVYRPRQGLVLEEPLPDDDLSGMSEEDLRRMAQLEQQPEEGEDE